MPGMAFKARVVDFRDCWVSFQNLRNSQRTLILIFHPHCQGLYAAVQEETGVRIEGASKVIEFVGDRFD